MSFEAAPVLIPGVEVELGGRKFVVPPLPLGALRQLAKYSDAATSGTGNVSSASVDALIGAMHRTLRRNYPQITVEEVEDLLDVPTAIDLFGRLNQLSGLEPSADEGAAPLGESSGGSSTAG